MKDTHTDTRLNIYTNYLVMKYRKLSFVSNKGGKAIVNMEAENTAS
jgi:hypothetical protein